MHRRRYLIRPDQSFHATAAQVEKLVRAYRCVVGRVGRLAEREQAMASHAARELNYYHDDDGSLIIRARLPAEEGAVVLQALNAAMDAQCKEEHEDAVDDVTAVTSGGFGAGAQGICVTKEQEKGSESNYLVKHMI